MGCDPGRHPKGVRPQNHFNPRTPCGVRRQRRERDHVQSPISIHAPRVGCDARSAAISGNTSSFQSTHPVWDATINGSALVASYSLFQSTHPVWGATAGCTGLPGLEMYFNPRTPCGVRLDSCHIRGKNSRISIHAPRVGCDYKVEDFAATAIISIHAPRVGCDGHSLWRRRLRRL